MSKQAADRLARARAAAIQKQAKREPCDACQARAGTSCRTKNGHVAESFRRARRGGLAPYEYAAEASRDQEGWKILYGSTLQAILGETQFIVFRPTPSAVVFGVADHLRRKAGSTATPIRPRRVRPPN